MIPMCGVCGLFSPVYYNGDDWWCKAHFPGELREWNRARADRIKEQIDFATFQVYVEAKYSKGGTPV